MKICWVVADEIVLDPTLDISVLKEIGPIWGSWKTWRSCGTDNVICHDDSRARELIKRDFQNLCNFYVHSDTYQFLGRPSNLNLYQGNFPDQLDNPDEIIAMHLAASQNDIVLLMGFKWITAIKSEDRLLEHRAHVYKSLVFHTIKNNSNVQWVAIDHPDSLIKELGELDNLTQDTLPNVLKLLSS